VLLFREAKPFSPGEGSWAKGQFPPSPLTVFQALRSTLTISKNTDRDLQFLGVFLLDQNNEIWLPTPKDLIAVGEKQETEEDNLDEHSSNWHRTSRLIPADQNEDTWKHLCFDNENLPPMVAPKINSDEFICRPETWIKFSALKQYLQGENPNNTKDFTEEPWGVQILPHTQMQENSRQVKDSEGYFTEVAIRLKPNWRLVAGINIKISSQVVRLGGEGHRILITPLTNFSAGNELINNFNFDGNTNHNFAYLLTPGLAEVEPYFYGVYPSNWQKILKGCVSDRPLLLGGVSSIQRCLFNAENKGSPEFSLLPQRAFVPPGTVYLFNTKPANCQQLLPENNSGWLQTFKTLNYGKLLWGKCK
jgi:CRISPR-associated protein Cmr3